MSNLRFLEENPTYARAALELAMGLPAPRENEALGLLERGFEAGQDSGELRAFAPHDMAVALRGAIDASVLDIVINGVDAALVAADLAELFDRAIRA